MRRILLAAILSVLAAASAWALTPVQNAVLFSAPPPPPPPTLLFTEGAHGTPPPNSPSWQYSGGSQTFINTPSDAQCTWTFPYAVPAGSTVVGYTHQADATDNYPFYPDYVQFGTATMFLSATVEWYPFPEPINLFYLVNVPGGVTTITADFGASGYPHTLNFCDFGFSVYSGATSVVVTNPILYSGSSPNPSITISPTQSAVLWGFSSPNQASPIGLGPPGYTYIIDDMDTDGIGVWQSPSPVAAGSYGVSFGNPGYNTACNGPLGDPNPCPIVLMGAAVQNGASPP